MRSSFLSSRRAVDGRPVAPLILSSKRLANLRRDSGRAYRQVVEARFWNAVDRIPRDLEVLVTSTNAQVAQRLHNALLLLGGALAIEGSREIVEQAQSLLEVIDSIELTPGFDEMYVGYLAVALVAFDDLASQAVPPETRVRLRQRIVSCGEWLAAARCSKKFGREGQPGIYAWNHSVVAALAMSLCGTYLRSRTMAKSWMDFGHMRLDKFLSHGLSREGVPYEGLAYFGISLRIMGLYGLLIGRDPDGLAEYRSIRATHDSRLVKVLEWYDACAFPKGRYVISYNHSGYTPHFPIQGLLLFFGDTNPAEVAELWHRLVPGAETKAGAGFADLLRSSTFEGMFFLNRPRPEVSPFRAASTVDTYDGYLMLRGGARTAEDRLFIKSGRHLRGPHNQSDVNHYTLFLGGDPVLIDAGPGAKVREAQRRWPEYSKGSYRAEGSAASSYGHNAILIDGRGQAPSGDGHGVSGEIVSCSFEDGAWIASASATDAYCKDDYNPVRWAVRHWVFVCGPRALVFVFDDIESACEEARVYERLLHTPEIVDAVETTQGHRLAMRWSGTEYRITALGGACGEMRTEIEKAPGPAPFRHMSTIRQAVRARNPYFWLLITRDDQWAESPSVTMEEDAEWWRFEVRHGDEVVRRVQMWKAGH